MCIFSLISKFKPKCILIISFSFSIIDFYVRYKGLMLRKMRNKIMFRIIYIYTLESYIYIYIYIYKTQCSFVDLVEMLATRK